MKKFSASVPFALKAFGNHSNVDLLARRTAEVRQMWSAVVSKMWPDEEASNMILQHTNMVGISQENGYKKLFVYVNDSIVLSELNALRERIKLLFLTEHNEAIEEFDIKISQGTRKKNQLYAPETVSTSSKQKPSIPLSKEEIDEVCRKLESIESLPLRESLYKAMISDLEWKKGMNGENNENN